MIRILLIGLCTVAVANSAESPEAWIEKLSATYAKHSGFIATYQSEGDGKSLEATLALDETSGIALIGADVANDGKNRVVRQWLTKEDELFADTDGDRVKASGPLTELKSLVALLSASLTVPVNGSQGLFSSHFTPQLLLKRDSVEQILFATPQDQPPWFRSVTGSPVTEVTENAVTFKTRTYGHLTISREHGLLLSQSLIGADDEERVLTLTKLELSPTVDQINDISRDWSTLGATPIPVGTITADARHNVFQMIVEAVERGVADLEELETLLEEQRVLLRRLAASGITENSSLANIDWKTALANVREAVRAHWLETVPGAEADDEKAFEAHLGNPDVREQVRESLVSEIMPVMLRHDGAAARVMPDFFGPNPAHVLKSDGVSGKVAKSMIETALIRACFEAHIDLRMATAWGERSGLD